MGNWAEVQSSSTRKNLFALTKGAVSGPRHHSLIRHANSFCATRLNLYVGSNQAYATKVSWLSITPANLATIRIGMPQTRAIDKFTVCLLPVQTRYQARRSLPTSRLLDTNPNVFGCSLLVRACGSLVQLFRTPACHAGGRGFNVPSPPPNSARVVTVSGRRLELVESPALLSFTIGLTHPRNRVRKSDTVGSVSDWRLSRHA
jgi:hypothetical protein